MDTILNPDGEITVTQLVFYRKFRKLEVTLLCLGPAGAPGRYVQCLLHDLSLEEETAIQEECRQPALGGQLLETATCWCWTKAPEAALDLLYSTELILEMAAYLATQRLPGISSQASLMSPLQG